MATAGETSYQGGGAGGKFRKKSNRMDSKPYDRAPNSRRTSSESVKTASFSKRIVDSASRTITENAQKLFSLMFRKNPPALPTISEANHELRDASPEEVPCNSSGDQERVSDEGGNADNNSDRSAIDDLEQILKQKTFTRAEVDQLTELLRTRTSDVSAVNEKRMFEPNASEVVKGPIRDGSVQVQENEAKSQALLVTMPAPLGNSTLLEEDVASPTELAKAYMGRRTSRVSPSTLGLRSQPIREDTMVRTSLPFTPKSSSHATRTAVRYDSVPRGPENGYLTPVVPRGRSAIYSMGRTPYSRVHHSVTLKGVGPMTGEKAVPSTSSQRSWENTLLSGGRQASKRRSSVLNNDIGSIGPIRRVRRKTDMMSPSENTGLSLHRASPSIPFTPIGSDTAKGAISSVQKQFQLDSTHNTSARGPMESGESSKASKGFVCVPNQSRETAQKILQQLEKFVPSPKGKSCELKLTTALETSPSKFTPGMLQGQVLKSVGGVDSSKLLRSAHANGKLDGSGDDRVGSAWNLTSEKQARVNDKGPSSSEDKLESEANGTTRSTKDAASLKSISAFTSSSVAMVPQKKDAFEKNVNKDSLDLEENNLNSGDGSDSLVTGKGKHDKPLVESREIADGAVTVGVPLSSAVDIENSGSLKLKKLSDTQDSDVYPTSEKDNGLTYSTANDTTAVAKPAQSASVSPSFKGTPSANETTGALFSFASKTVDNGAPFTFSSASVGIESGRTGTLSESKLENSRSADALSSGESSPASASTTSGIFSFGVSTSSSLSNGSSASSTPLFAFPASAPVSDINTTSAPLFKFGSNTSASSSPFSSASKAPEASATESKSAENKMNSVFGTPSNSSFGIKTPTFMGSSSSTFAFGGSTSSSVNSPSFGNQIQGSNIFDAATKSAPGTMSAPSSTPTMPMQFGSSASSQTFGWSGASSSGTGGSLFGSSSTATTFGSQYGSTFQTEGFKFGSSSVASTFGSAPAAFGSSLGSQPVSIFSVTSAAALTSSPLSSSPGNDQMNIEDNMSEHTVQASTPITPGFAPAPSLTQPSAFAFGAASSGSPNMFQFSSQQDPTTSQHQTPIQASGSFGASGGGSFSLGTGGGDKSKRKFFKARRDKSRKG